MASLDFVVDTFVGSDGSKYYGTLKNGVPSGLGTCIWPNHCHYDGEWRNGVMHGFGTYVWKNGQRYDGEWKDGRREGIGIKTYVDGSMYDGFWKAGKKHGLGVFRPAPEEPSSRRHSNTHWQSPAGSAPGQQTAAGTEDGGIVPSMPHVESSQVLAEAEADAAAAAAQATAEPAAGTAAEAMAATDSLAAAQPAALHQQQQTCRQPERATSPFADVAAALNSEMSVVLPPTGLTAARQQWQPMLEPITNGDAAAGQQDALTAAAQADVPSFSPTGAKGAAADGNTDLAAAQAAAAAPRKLFVREYDMGQLLREYPLTAEEIKMIFGFLWRKNKVRRRVQKVLRRGPRMQKKLGEVVYKGHYSYSLMLELQLGIRYSVGKALRPRGCASGPSASSLFRHSIGLGLRPWWSVTAAISNTGCVSGGHVKDEVQYNQQQQQRYGQQQQQLQGPDSYNSAVEELVDLDFKEKLTVYFPSSGSSTTPAHPSTDFMWKDYCPRVFRRMRAAAGIDEADYMLSLAGSQALRQLNSPGKSGSMFLLSDDERFLVKTMRKSEMSVLLNMMPKYAAHMEQYPNSLITRFFGLHKVTPLHGRSVRFVVMANIFVTELQIHRRYDIKGSTDGRTVGAEARAKAADGDPSVIFKDLDVDMRIVLEQSAHEQLMTQLKADCELLRDVGVMDYSLLLGVHYPARNFTRFSLEPVPSASMDGLMPHTSPLPQLGGNTAPGSAVVSAQGSFVLMDPVNGTAVGAAHPAPTAAAFAATARSTISDDEVQQPPEQLIRLVAVQQHQQAQLMVQLAQAQQQQRALQAELSGTTGGAETPILRDAGGTAARSARSSLEQVPYLQFVGRRSTSEDVQFPPSVSAFAAANTGSGATGCEASAAAVSSTGGFSSGNGAGVAPSATNATAGLSGAGSAAGSQHGAAAGMLGVAVSMNAAGARNWELWNGAAQQEEQLSKAVERMQAMGFSEQRIKDVAELARLKILGGKLKKSATRKEPPSAVLQAMQQQRQEAEGTDSPLVHGSLIQPVSPTAAAAGAAAGHLFVRQQPVPMHLTSLRGAFTGLGVPFEEDEEIVDTPMALGLPDPKAPAAVTAAAGLAGCQQLGINMSALGVPTVATVGAACGGKSAAGAGALDFKRPPDEVVLCFGIIDILQDYSTRKVLERTVKGVTHEKAAISVAPPKQYAKRFLDFVTNEIFMSEAEYKQHMQQAGVSGSHGGAMSTVQHMPPPQLHHSHQASGVLQLPPWGLPPIVTNAAGAAVSSLVTAAATGGIVISPVSATAATPGQQGSQPLQQQQQVQFGQLPLVTEDSLPIPPGQLSVDKPEVPPAASVDTAAGRMVLKQRGPSAASPVLPDATSPLLDLLAAPSGMIQLTSGDVDCISADGVALSLGHEESHAGDELQQGSVGHGSEPADGMLVPAVVVELQGIVPSASGSKHSSLDGQQNAGSVMNGTVV